MIDKITTHQAEALERVLTQYKDKPNFVGLVDIIAEQVQDAEDLFFDLFDFYKISDAEGEWLNAIGKIVGQQRFNTSDAIYRGLIQARIGRNISTGTFEVVVSIFKLLTNSINVQVTELDYASLSLMGDGEPDPLVESFLKDFMQASVGAGIGLAEVGQFDDDMPFVFSDEVLPEPSFGGGFGSDDPTETEGGELGKLF